MIVGREAFGCELTGHAITQEPIGLGLGSVYVIIQMKGDGTAFGRVYTTTTERAH